MSFIIILLIVALKRLVLDSALSGTVAAQIVQNSVAFCILRHAAFLIFIVGWRKHHILRILESEYRLL